jgi:hypothetical protein
MNDFRYSLIRFVPDLERMEPFNVGIILQGQGKLDFRLSPHVAKRKDVDTVIFQKWRSFLEEEIRGEEVPYLQPPKLSREFLEYLARMCDQTMTISRPLYLSERPEEGFESVLQSLYDRLVAPPDQRRKEQSPRPTSTFRDLEEAKQFRKRGMKKHPYVSLPGEKQRWNAYRQVVNGQDIVVDKVEVNSVVGLTADEIQKLSSGVGRFLERFLHASHPVIPPRYVLIADELREKFTDQTDEDYQAMKDELQGVLDVVRSQGGEILRDPREVQEFAEEVDKKLPTLEELQKAG